MTISEQNLMFWIKNNLNVLFKGKHGVGKTSMILEAFDKNKLKWQYFSAATMDPWVDFVGVPKERIDANGKSYLDLVRPKHFQDDEVEAIFMDEFNRASKKVRNAVMELIQFKSINGKKFNNLKIVWAAVNPDDDKDEEYDVEKLDPAQLDRFHVHVDVPYAPSVSFFKAKHGNEAAAALEWWHGLTNDEKTQVSPRRLDYALEMYKLNGDLRFVIPKTVNVSKLLNQLKNGSYSDQLKTVFESKDVEAMRKFISDENCLASCIKQISKSDEMMNAFLPLINKERIASIVASDKTVFKFIIENAKSFVPLLQQLQHGGNAKIKKQAHDALVKLQPPVKKITKSAGGKFLSSNLSHTEVEAKIQAAKMRTTRYYSSTIERVRAYNILVEVIADANAAQRLDMLSVFNTIAYSSQAATLKTKMPLLGDAMKLIVDTDHSSRALIYANTFKKVQSVYGLKI